MPMTAVRDALPYRPLDRRPRPAQGLLRALVGGAVGAGFAALTMIAPAQARGPEAIADVAEKVIDAVVNISTSQTVEVKSGDGAMPQLPPGLEDFFDELNKNRRGGKGGGGAQPTRSTRSARASSSTPRASW